MLFVRQATTDFRYIDGGVVESHIWMMERLESTSYLNCSSVSYHHDPLISGQPWQYYGCSPALIPTKASPLAPQSACFARYATAATPDANTLAPGLPFLKIETTGRTAPARGRSGMGLDLMGYGLMSDRTHFGTTYWFDRACDLPHLRVVPLTP